MPELPDVTVYVEALRERVLGETLTDLRLANPFLLRTADPPVSAIVGRQVSEVRRIGKRIVFGFETDLFLILHLMIAGRLHWKDHVARAPIPGKLGLGAFDFGGRGTLILTEAGTKRRASLHLAAGRAALAAIAERGGFEVQEASLAAFRAALTRESHTLKRALTDPQIFSGVGNAYSDEVLHAARLSPLQLTSHLGDDEIARLYDAIRAILAEWTERLRQDAKRTGGFPEKVTAFREGMAVHGRYRQPCPVCGTPVQRIVYADNECDYCPTCQTGGKLLADRALSRLLRGDWPRTVDELENRRAPLPTS